MLVSSHTQNSDEVVVDTTAFDTNVRCSFYENEPRPVYAVHDSELYFFNNGALSKLVIAWDNGLQNYKATIDVVEGKEVSVSQSTSIGFNMMDDDPYCFVNNESSVDTLTVQGVLPYSATDSTVLRLSANPGETIKFVTYYDYYLNKHYRFKWEVAEYGTTNYTTLIDYGNYTGRR